jgi:hypothetical protein
MHNLINARFQSGEKRNEKEESGVATSGTHNTVRRFYHYNTL